MRKLLVGCALAGAAIGGVIGAGPASAVKPAVKGCLGHSVSANAGALHPYGQVVLAPATPRSDLGSIGDAVRLVQTGQLDDEIFPNTCND
jgi:hypothetical protein